MYSLAQGICGVARMQFRGYRGASSFAPTDCFHGGDDFRSEFACLLQYRLLPLAP